MHIDVYLKVVPLQNSLRGRGRLGTRLGMLICSPDPVSKVLCGPQGWQEVG